MSEQSPLSGLDLIKAWVTALRSGTYNQGQSQLAQRQEDGTIQYCCLGVLCEVADLKPTFMEDGTGRYPAPEGGTVSLYPPSDVAERALFPQIHPKFGEYGAVDTHFSNLNDNKGYTFDQIADEVEKVFGVEG
jgi:hypothetical protein